MSGYLLDTNVVSELTKQVPDRGVVAFLSERNDVWLSLILIHEIEFGLRLLPAGNRRERLMTKQAEVIAAYSDRILPLDREAAEWAAEFRAHSRRAGWTIDLGDALVAGIARANGLAVATCDVRDFQALDIEVINPWDAGDIVGVSGGGY